MKIDKLIPGALNAISNIASSPAQSSPTGLPPPSPSLTGGDGSGGGGGGAAAGKGKKRGNKRSGDGKLKPNPPPNSPPGKPTTMITPGAFAANCSWSGQVLTIKRDT